MVHSVLVKSCMPISVRHNVRHLSHFEHTHKHSTTLIPVHYALGSSTLQISGVHIMLSPTEILSSPSTPTLLSLAEQKPKSFNKLTANTNESANTIRENSSLSKVGELATNDAFIKDAMMTRKAKFEYFSSRIHENNTSSNNDNNDNDNNNSGDNYHHVHKAMIKDKSKNSETSKDDDHSSSNSNSNNHMTNTLTITHEKVENNFNIHSHVSKQELEVSACVRVTARVRGESDLESKEYVVGVVWLRSGGDINEASHNDVTNKNTCNENNKTVVPHNNAHKLEKNNISFNNVQTSKRDRSDYSYISKSSHESELFTSSSLSSSTLQTSTFLKLDLRVQVEHVEFMIDVIDIKLEHHSHHNHNHDHVHETQVIHGTNKQDKQYKMKHWEKVPQIALEVAVVGTITALV